MTELSEIFKDPEELEVAQAVVLALPEDIGESPFFRASIKGLVFEAYKEQTHPVSSAGAALLRQQQVEYIKSHKIMSRLEENGLAASGGCSIRDSLYVKPRNP